MTDYTSHADSLFDAGKPILGVTHLEARDNLIASGEGSTGSPSFVPNYGANVAAGDIGTYVFARYTGTGEVSFGSTVAGSLLEPTSAFWGGETGDSDFSTDAALTGTWECMGKSIEVEDLLSGQDSALAKGATLWVRLKV